ncbi:hypothetical protein OSH11_00070 [Kaistia dalseonensis]|uniref:Uncharacterized protein n=1 Tax=Kaistia dalseonensis TaxID=410840 RepID=A0ABU0H004_9HYPH|nr:hypothetical protein [Kaistia dalseonensis]MCX5493090.1 hypothetical protein [Kaistia dalseonensis]MDQ0435645.1 hypothetical protein [Kaistia dalseonensis]
MLKAVIVAAIGGILSGHSVRNGWRALFLIMALILTETGVEAARHHLPPETDVGVFAMLDTVGSFAMLVGGALAV